MKVILVQSYLGGAEPRIFPIGLACLKSSLPVDYDVMVYDTNTSESPFDDLAKIIKDFVPDVIGISLRNIDSTNKRKAVFYYGYLKDAIDVIKTRSNARIIVGGSGFSIFAKEIMEDEPRIDYGVFLEGEATFPKLLQNLDSPENVGSIFYRKNGKVFFPVSGRQVDLNRINLPDRGAVPLDKYKKIPEAIGVETKRGCILDCIYCIYGFLNGKELRLRDPVKVVDEIELLVKKYDVQRFTFVDAVFNIPLEHAEMICKELLNRRIKVNWSAWFNERVLSKGFIELARDAGCENIILSPDGFSDEVLKKLGKNLTKYDIIRSYKILKDIDGLEVSYNFFKNPPGQNLTTFLSLINFCIKSKIEMKERVHFEFNSIRIEPYTKLYQMAVDEGAIKRGESLLYPKYYTNPATRYIEKIFNIALIMMGK